MLCMYVRVDSYAHIRVCICNKRGETVADGWMDEGRGRSAVSHAECTYYLPGLHCSYEYAPVYGYSKLFYPDSLGM